MSTSEASRRYYLANREKKLAAVKANYEAKKASIIARNKRTRIARLNWFRKWCLGQAIACACGESNPHCLDFHHRDPTIKLGQVPLLSGRGWSKERILTEVAKCVVMCANCHRKEHFHTKPKRPKRAWLWELKESIGCECGESHPPCLDFHHRDPATKTNSVTKMVVAGHARATIMAEIAKCDLLCANCHRRLHHFNPASGTDPVPPPEAASPPPKTA